MGWHGYLLISEIPPGWSISERQNAHKAMKSAGRQSGPTHLKTASRGNGPDTLDDEGNPNGAATVWIVEGDFTPDELERSYWVDIIATELDVNPVAVDAKINYEILGGLGCTYADSWVEVTALLVDNSADWEPVND